MSSNNPISSSSNASAQKCNTSTTSSSSSNLKKQSKDEMIVPSKTLRLQPSAAHISIIAERARKVIEKLEKRGSQSAGEVKARAIHPVKSGSKSPKPSKPSIDREDKPITTHFKDTVTTLSSSNLCVSKSTAVSNSDANLLKDISGSFQSNISDSEMSKSQDASFALKSAQPSGAASNLSLPTSLVSKSSQSTTGLIAKSQPGGCALKASQSEPTSSLLSSPKLNSPVSKSFQPEGYVKSVSKISLPTSSLSKSSQSDGSVSVSSLPAGSILKLPPDTDSKSPQPNVFGSKSPQSGFSDSKSSQTTSSVSNFSLPTTFVSQSAESCMASMLMVSALRLSTTAMVSVSKLSDAATLFSTESSPSVSKASESTDFVPKSPQTVSEMGFVSSEHLGSTNISDATLQENSSKTATKSDNNDKKQEGSSKAMFSEDKRENQLEKVREETDKMKSKKEGSESEVIDKKEDCKISDHLCEESELQKRIEELKNEITWEKLKMEEIKVRVAPVGDYDELEAISDSSNLSDYDHESSSHTSKHDSDKKETSDIPSKQQRSRSRSSEIKIGSVTDNTRKQKRKREESKSPDKKHKSLDRKHDMSEKTDSRSHARMHSDSNRSHSTSRASPDRERSKNDRSHSRSLKDKSANQGSDKVKSEQTRNINRRSQSPSGQIKRDRHQFRSRSPVGRGPISRTKYQELIDRSSRLSRHRWTGPVGKSHETRDRSPIHKSSFHRSPVYDSQSFRSSGHESRIHKSPVDIPNPTYQSPHHANLIVEHSHKKILHQSLIDRRPRSRSHSSDEGRHAMSRFMRRSPSSSRRTGEHSDSCHRSKSRGSKSRPGVADDKSRSSSFELDWPGIPCQPGISVKEKRDCISPISQLYSVSEIKMSKVGWSDRRLSKSYRDWGFASILSVKHRAKRTAQLKCNSGVWRERCIESFEVIRSIGNGTYGQVFKAADKDNNLLVALKKIKTSNTEGFRLSALREMTSLRLLDHANIIRLLEIIQDRKENETSTEIAGMYYFVYEYVAHDLEGILESKLVKLSNDNISYLMKQLLNALSYCHSHALIHCDVKTSNILINYRCELKLTQFGTVRMTRETNKQDESYTNKLGSLWYRSPEMLLGTENYGPAVDMWSCGCVLGEMFILKAIFPGKDDFDVMQMISGICGTPNPIVWTDVALLPRYYTIKSRTQYHRRLRQDFYFLPLGALDLLDCLLTLDPLKRCSADAALKLDWIQSVDLHKMPPIHLPKTLDCHSLQTETKSEPKEVIKSTGTKPLLNPSESGKMQLEDHGKGTKKELGITVSEASARILEALRQHSLQPQQQSSNSTPSKPSVSSSTTTTEKLCSDRIVELSAALKPLFKNIMVKDYQHQQGRLASSTKTVLKTEDADTFHVPTKQADKSLSSFDSGNKQSAFLEKLNWLKAPQCENEIKTINEQSFMSSQAFISGLTRSNIDSAKQYCEKDNTSKPSKSDRESRVLPPSSSGSADSGISFWNAVKEYCATFDTSAEKSTLVKEKTLPEPYKDFNRTSYSNESYGIGSGRRNEESVKQSGVNPLWGQQKRGLCDNLYEPLRKPHTLNPQIYSNMDANIRRQLASATTFDYGHFSPNQQGRFSERSHFPSTAATAAYREAIHASSGSNIRNLHVSSATGRYGEDRFKRPQQIPSGEHLRQSASLSTTTKLISSTRVHQTTSSEKPLNVDSEKVVPRKGQPLSDLSSLGIVTNDDQLISAPTDVSLNVSTAQPATSSLPATVRPKLTGILKNKSEVNIKSDTEWKTLQRKL